MQTFAPTNSMLAIRPTAGVTRLASSRVRQACVATPKLINGQRARAGRSRLVCRAEDGSNQKIKPVDPKKEAEFAEALAKGGITKETAKKILMVWQQAGIDDPDQLRKVLVGRSLRTLGTAAFQLALDAGAAAASYGLGMEWLADNTFGGIGTPIASGITFLLAGYFASGAVFDLFTVGAITVASVQFRMSSGIFLAAVRDLAGDAGGPAAGVGVVDKAAQAASAARVVQALAAIQAALREGAAGDATGARVNTLDDLSSYLVLSNAEHRYGFDSSKYGLSSSQAATIAAEFAKFDANDDGMLDKSEFEAVAKKYVDGLSPEEVSGAFAAIDRNGDQRISFVEWVEFKQQQDLKQQQESKDGADKETRVAEKV